MFRCPRVRRFGARAPGGGRMADESGGPPLPRRVPGATVSPGTPIRVERPEIPEDLRQRVLTAIADELRRDEAVARYRAQEQPKAENPGVPEEAQRAQAGPPPVSDPQLAAALGDADLPAPGSDPAASAPTVWSPVPRPVDLPAPASDPAASAPTVWSPVPRPVDLPAPAPADLPAPAADQADLRAPVADEADLQAPAADRADVPVPAADGADLQAPVADRADLSGPTADEPDEQPIAPLPRRIPGTTGAPPPPAHLRRNFLPFSLLGRRLDPDGHTEPLPRITRFGADSPAVPDSAYRTGDPAAPTLPAGTSPFVPTPPGSAPAGTGPWAPGVPGSFGAGPDAGPTERGSGPGAPGADPDLPLRFADLAESGRAHDHFARSPGYVRSMVSFLHAQRLPYRPAHVATVHLAGGATALRVEFPAPSPLGLLGAHRA